MTISTKDLKQEDSKDKDIKSDLTIASSETEIIDSLKPVASGKKNKTETVIVKPVIEVTESLKPIEGVKTWKITLLDKELTPLSYTHPGTRKKFLKGVPVYTSNQSLAEDCDKNSYFDVQ